ncbi:MAG: nitrous oxide reductase accessory protein NosL [Chitinophagales bacterium]|nr:nitrous oxide reductase accessory protein NosL [Chitinophagales bacterium]
MKISARSKVMLAIAALALIISIFVPLWNIYLDAPQYPEGLVLQIYANKIGGNVDIINGLNHYIGMKTLHTEDFIEFKLLPYLIGFFALLFIIVALVGKRILLNLSLILFALFGVVSMVDFWRWLYDYGHNLDPNAAIKVPGMVYQPPLLGFKQLLNFGAFSIPTTGGWMFISAGVLVLIAVILENKFFSKFKKSSASLSVVIILSSLLFTSCSNNKPEPIALNKDACSFCKMSISDGRFATEIVTKKGRVYKFDDVSCMNGYISTQDKNNIAKYYVGNALKENELIDATQAWYIHNENIKSPMGGNTLAFLSKEDAEKKSAEYASPVKIWTEISTFYTNEMKHEGQHLY